MICFYIAPNLIEHLNKMEIEENDFYMRQKTFFLTFPNYDEDKETVFRYFLVKFKPKVLIVAKEQHMNGNYHFHIWLEFLDKITIRNNRYFDIQEHHCNIGKIRNTKCNSRKNVIRYITKFDKNPCVYGCDINKEGSIRRIIGERILEGDNINDIINDYPQEIYNYDKLIRNKELFNIKNNKVSKIIDRKCFWLYGPSGIGKSRLVRDSFNEIYEKSNNIWWDGYNNEKIVLIDDFDKTCIKLSYYLKIWGDNYRFNGEIKGSTIQPIYNKLIITSNYDIESLFFNREDPDNELIDALKRRYEEIYINDKNQLNEIEKIIKLEYRLHLLNLVKYNY